LGSSGDFFTTVRTEGGLLPADFIQRLSDPRAGIEGLSPESYHLATGEKINEAASRSWNRLVGAWLAFQEVTKGFPEGDPGTSVTREKWLLPLFQELGYGRLLTTRAVEIEGKAYPVSHLWHKTPIHLVGRNVDLDRPTRGVAGAARMSPHSLVQELLNRSDYLWAFLSNGLTLRILRDNKSFTRQAYVEFDLLAMMDGQAYSDFALLWLICHQSRVEAENPTESWLERWSRTAQEQGTRALDRLRDGVEAAITALGRGFLKHTANRALLDCLRSGSLTRLDYYRQLLRAVYRLIFLFVAEDRDLLLDPAGPPSAKERYTRHYSTRRLRALAEKRRGSMHGDLWQGLLILFHRLGSDEGGPELAIPPLGSFLWSEAAVPDLETSEVSNKYLLEAVRSLGFTTEGRVRQPIDYRNLGPEELGSVYEALLELQPVINAEAGAFELSSAPGHERKTTGSYYTPTSLISCLLDSALDPVLSEAAGQTDPERAILNLAICDPACGSGHFLIAAAHRIAKRLASARTGDVEPSPDALRRALREVIGHCLYGVDYNPMAVELCKVNLWLEALDPGKPLSFLEHRILCGNSLLGTTPALLEAGIPDEALDSIEGDDKAFARDLKKRNRREREGQTTFAFVAEPAATYASIAGSVETLEHISDETISGIREKEKLHSGLASSPEYLRERLASDAWCAAFFWMKTADAAPAITHYLWAQLRESVHSVPATVKDEVARLASEYRFFHWHLAFPDVFRVPGPSEKVRNAITGWAGGFDVVLGNPPWEHVELKEKEFFARHDPEIAAAVGSQRKRMIKELEREDPALFRSYSGELRFHEGIAHFLGRSGRYPLSGRGRINTYAIFAENFRTVTAPRGRAGLIVPTGIATDDTTKHFFRALMESRALESLYDFENRDGLFPSVDSRYKFCLLSLTGTDSLATEGADFAFYLFDPADLQDSNRRFTLSAEDLALINPNTRTCPIFRSLREAEITKSLYRRVPVLLREGDPKGNPWRLMFSQGLFNMTGDSALFRTRQQLETEEWNLKGNVFRKGEHCYLPLYEDWMFHQFNHRYQSHAVGELSEVTLRNPDSVAYPHYWVPAEEVNRRTAANEPSEWFIVYRRSARATDSRTVIAAIIPRYGAGDLAVIVYLKQSSLLRCSFAAAMNSFVFNFVARTKVAGYRVGQYHVAQIPMPAPSKLLEPPGWSQEPTHEWLSQRVLELVYTAPDLQPFGKDVGNEGGPFRWISERRMILRCELDAAFFRLYGLSRDETSYILDTFPVVRRSDEKQYGDYRTKLQILDIYDRMQLASDTGETYQTLLDPPPAHPSLAP
jgi:hypothetical protein